MKLEYLWQLTIILIGAFVSAYAGYYFAQKPDGNVVVEYYESSHDNLRSVLGNVDGLKIKYKNRELEKISRTSYDIFNSSEKNLDKFKVYFEFLEDGKKPLFHSVNVSKSMPDEAVNLISKEEGIYIFEVEYLNKTTRIFDGLSFNFYFADSSPPPISMKTGTKGVEIKKYEYEPKTRLDFLKRSIINLWWLIALYFILAIIGFKYNRSSKKLHTKDIDSALSEVLSEENDLSTEERKSRVKEVIESSPELKRVLSEWSKKSDD